MASCAERPLDVASERAALSAEQCLYFEENGKAEICHATGSSTHPYVYLRISDKACISGHSEHPGDYIAESDPTCGGLGCLPAAAPCDETLGCCEGLACMSGTCTPVLTEPTITPTHAFPGDPFTIHDSLGRILPGSLVLFYEEGADPALGTAAEGVVVSADGTTISAFVPGTLRPTEYFVAVRLTLQSLSYFSDLPFTADP
jgi:hypothetical protein